MISQLMRHSFLLRNRAKWRAHGHETLTHDHHLVDLLNLQDEKVGALKVAFGARVGDGLVDDLVVGL